MRKTTKIKKRGFVILFAVTISAILLSIALGVSNIAFRENKFGTSAKDTNDAFFAADAGLECALLHDKSTGSSFAVSPAPQMYCNNNNPYIVITQNPPSFWSFIVYGLNNNGQGCAKVTVDKRDIVTLVTSKGYNDGGGAGNCTPTQNSVERQIELSY